MTCVSLNDPQLKPRIMTTPVPNRPKLRLGIVAADALVSKYLFGFLKSVLSVPSLDVQLLVFAPGQGKGRGRTTISDVIFRAIVALETLLIQRNQHHHDHLQRFDALTLVPTGSVHRTSGDLRAAVKALDFDILIAFEDGFDISEVADLPRLGVISLEHLGDRISQGSPIGFWDVYFRNDTTEFSIRHFSGYSSATELLRGRVGTQFYYSLNQASVFEKSAYYLTRLVEEASRTGRLPVALGDGVFSANAHGRPKSHQSLWYLASLLYQLTRKLARKALAIERRWNVGFVRSNWRDVVHSDAAVIENPKGRYLADPFVIERGGSSFCFVEDFDEKTGRGRISVYKLGETDAVFVGPALEENFHLSFPYLFEYRNELYMCPETSGNRDIRIYKCLEFPLTWKLEKVVMTGLSAVDSMLVEKNGRWWLLTNIDPAQWDDFSLELHVFHADSPLAEVWHPHPSNPLLIDASRTRNGGLIRQGTRLFRVAQGLGLDIYGKRATVYEIVQLDESHYVEQCRRMIEPTFRKGVAGTHHLHSNDTYTVFDFLR
jgi:hypothetical protein